ncbi:MAG: KamA family radical SAM protein [Planctomycetaceae bacterium]|nr:KamA family radical SAM protein [Planctomycetaceae bacterium]
MSDTDWQTEFSAAVTDTNVLCRHLDVPAVNVETGYPLLVPKPFIQRMETGNPNDPLLLQVLPQPEELQETIGFSADPLNESAAGTNGILIKYPHRALVLASPHCGIHCRFCFRRCQYPFHFPHTFPFQQKNEADILMPLHRIQDGGIEEIILSGGDPLMFGDERLSEICQHIIQMPNIKRLRIHSRLPIVLPSRITPQLNAVLDLPIPVYLVLHVNHPNELNDAFVQHRRLLRSPVLLSQTVLLRRINDDIETLAKLFTALTDIGIVPYYLHQLDKIQSAAHFEVSIETGCRLIKQLRSRLSGYAVPRYVREVAGASCKEIL